LGGKEGRRRHRSHQQWCVSVLFQVVENFREGAYVRFRHEGQVFCGAVFDRDTVSIYSSICLLFCLLVPAESVKVTQIRMDSDNISETCVRSVFE